MTEKAQNAASKQNPAGLMFLALAGLLLVAFFYYRGDDVGKLPASAGGLFAGGLFGAEGFGGSLLGLVVAILVVAAWFGLGRLFTEFFEKSADVSSALGVAQSCGFGAALWSLAWFFAGLVGGYRPATAIVSLAAGVGLAIYFAARDFRALKTAENSEAAAAERTSVFGKAASALLFFVLLLALVAALAPPTAKDTLLYHEALPKAFVAQGGGAIVEGNIASFLALGAEMHNVWALLLGGQFGPRAGEAAVGATAFAFAPLLLAAVYGWARELKVKKDLAVLAALMVAAIPTFYYVAASVYVDLAMALYATLAVRAAARWWATLEFKWLAYLSLALGAALSIKLTALFFIAGVALIVLLRARAAQNGETGEEASAEQQQQAAGRSKVFPIFAGGMAALLCAGLIAGPWYLRTWAKTGSPLFPFYLNLWGGSAAGWDAERSVLFQVINARYGGADKGLFDYLLAPIRVSLIAQPEIPEYYDGVLGVAFLLGLILIVWAWRRAALPAEVKIIAGLAGIFFLFWLFSSEQLRYLLPIAPSLAVATALAAQLLARTEGFRKMTYAALLAACAGGVLVSFAWFAEKSPLRVALGGESRAGYLTRQLDYYPYYAIVNEQLPPDAKIWLIDMRRDTYHLERPYFSDYFSEDWTLKKLVEESRDVGELRRRAKQMGVTHVLTRHDFLLDYDRSVIVDDRRAKAENDAKLKITEDFVLDKNNRLAADKKFSLVKLQ